MNSVQAETNRFVVSASVKGIYLCGSMIPRQAVNGLSQRHIRSLIYEEEVSFDIRLMHCGHIKSSNVLISAIFYCLVTLYFSFIFRRIV